MEHHYEVPKISDIELYYDLVSAFISVIQGLIFLLDSYREVDFTINVDGDGSGMFSSTYNDEKLEITVEWHLNNDKESTTLKVKLDELNEFMYFFKVHILLVQLDTFAKWGHVYSKIKLNRT